MPSETQFVKVNNRSRQYSAEQRKTYVAKWEQSQLSCREFCQREELCLNNFYYWVKKYHTKPLTKSKPKLTFIALKTNHEIGAHTGSPIEVYLPNGMRCCFRSQVDIQTLVRIVERLSHVTYS